MVSKTDTVSTMFLMICCLQQPKTIVRVLTFVINRAEKLHNGSFNDQNLNYMKVKQSKILASGQGFT